MAASAFFKIAERDREFGSPGLAHTMQILADAYDELDDEAAQAYDEFWAELNAYTTQTEQRL